MWSEYGQVLTNNLWYSINRAKRGYIVDEEMKLNDENDPHNNARIVLKKARAETWRELDEIRKLRQN